jgi:hypothetical protein
MIFLRLSQGISIFLDGVHLYTISSSHPALKGLWPFGSGTANHFFFFQSRMLFPICYSEFFFSGEVFVPLSISLNNLLRRSGTNASCSIERVSITDIKCFGTVQLHCFRDLCIHFTELTHTFRNRRSRSRPAELSFSDWHHRLASLRSKQAGA